MAEIDVRLANLGDLASIQQINLDFESDHVWKSQMMDDMDTYSINFQIIKLPKTIHVQFPAVSEPMLEKMIRRQEVAVAQFDNQIAGYVRMEQDDNVNRLLLKTGGVRSEFRRKGIASALLQVIQNTAISNNISQLVCTVQAKNEPAIHFLTSRGFQFCGYQEFYFTNLEIALFFSKNIR